MSVFLTWHTYCKVVIIKVKLLRERFTFLNFRFAPAFTYLLHRISSIITFPFAISIHGTIFFYNVIYCYDSTYQTMLATLNP